MTAAPASPQEQALWLLERMVPGTAANNLSVAFEVQGDLDPAVLQGALDVILRRYPALRTTFSTATGRLTREGRDECAVPVEHLDEPADVTAALDAFVARPFTVDGESLVRALHVSTRTRDAFCLAVHHLIFDTISGDVVRRELVAAYDALARGDATPAELATVVPETPTPEPTSRSTGFWREQLQGFDPTGLDMWIGGSEVANPSLVGGQALHDLSADAVDAVRELQRRLRAPEAVVLLAAYYLLLARHGAGPDIVVGSPVSVRAPSDQEAVGYHVNVLPLRVEVDLDQPFAELVKRVRSVFLDALSHVDVPVEALLDDLPRRESTWHNPIFRHAFNYVPGRGLPAFEIDDLSARPVVIENGYSKFDLEFFVLAASGSIGLRAVYGVEAFEHGEVVDLLQRYDRLLTTLGRDETGSSVPTGSLDISDEHDLAVVGRANDTATSAGPTSILAAVRGRVVADPGAVAVETGSDRVGFGRLWATVERNADALRDAGVRPADVVAVMAQRGPELAAAVLGVWLAGAAYMPIDPQHPADRIRYQLDDSGSRAVLTDDPGAVPAGSGAAVVTVRPVEPAGDGVPAALHAEPDPDAVANLIYTSGSTGLPKGTLINHRSFANVLGDLATRFRFTAEDSMLWQTTFSFDISAVELFLPLIVGGRVVVAPDATRTDGRALAEVVEQHGVSFVQATPTTWRAVVDKAGEALAGCRVLCGGEVLPGELAVRLEAVAAEVWNAYAPTETTMYSTAGRVRTAVDGSPGVGVPIANTTVFIVDPAGRDLPVGVRGELCVAGTGVAVGYHDREELTRERFPTHPVHGRYYRTGDLAQWRADGTILVLGRIDRQVKIRGNRVEPGEVEAVLTAAPQVRAAAVTVDHDPDGYAVLVAHVAAEDEAGLDELLWQRARAALPAAAVPSEFFFLDAFPMTGNQKVDHSALTRLAREKRDAARAADPAPAVDDELVETLVALWAELLDRSDVGADSNFFTVGGHSLMAAQLAQRAEESIGLPVQMSDVFAQPTPRRLGSHLRSLAP